MNNGEEIVLTVDTSQVIKTKTLKQIDIESRFNEHFDGNFTEYWLKDEMGDSKKLILQIHPDLLINKQK